MPARELGSSFDAPNGFHGVATTLLKRHKILPHPREERFPDSYSTPPAMKPGDLAVDTGISSIPSSDTSSPRTLKHASKRIGVLPPTPPTHSRQSSGTHPTVVAAPRFDLTSIKKDIASTPGTPPNQRSPPTPDVTPPRALRMPLAFRPPINDRHPSSRTDSFKTARENPYSSDEDEVSTVRPVLPSARTSATEIPQMTRRPVRLQKRKEIGLGLGLESDNEEVTTPTPTPAKIDQEEFVVFDGEWGSTGDASEVEREWDDNLMRNVVVRKRPGRNMHMFTDNNGDEILENHLVTPTMAAKVVRNMPLQDRIARHRLARETANRGPTENFADRIAWPQPASEPESPLLPDVRRFSTTSGPSVTSTVIEAMVVDAPPLRRKTLRHTKKQVGLRDLGSDQSTRSSGPDSVTSSEPRHRLHHSSQKLPERKHRSVTSNATVRTTSSSGQSRKQVLKSGGIPVVVVPERRSSSRSRAPSLRSTSSHRTKRSASVNSGHVSAPLSQSSKYNEPGYFDSIPRRKRALSESAGSGSEHTIDFPPKVPVRRSSLSAPTSRNTSRASSLTAESLKAHNMIQQKQQQVTKSKSYEPPDLSAGTERDAGIHHHRTNVDHNGDPFFGNRLSTQVTPFSQASYETAGTTAEVSEAMAVTIFPHQNKSVLVVQHTTPSDPTLPALQTAPTPTMTVNGTTTTGPITPPQPAHPMDEVDSPLRNPRDPPEPPAIKFIPATPSGLTPSQERDEQTGYPFHIRPATSGDGPKRTMSLMRRLSSRRASETAEQRPGFLTRTFSLTGRRKDGATQTSKPEANLSTVYPSVLDHPQDGTKLHPFWRPAHFWDDLEDQEDGDDEYGRYPPIDNRPQRTFGQKLKRTFAILPIEDDRQYHSYARDRRTVRRTPSEKLRVVKQRSNSSLRREGSDRRTYSEVRSVTGPAEGTFGHGFREGNGGRIHVIPGLGLRVEYVGWSGMKRKLSERRREKRSERLRQIISGPKGVRSGMDDVLRRKGQA